MSAAGGPAPTPTFADLRARLAAQWESAADPFPFGPPPVVEHLAGAPCPPGYDAWQVGSSPGSTVILPALVSDAPLAVRSRYLARIVANASGTCPLCDAVASVSADPEGRPAAWHALPVTVAVRHEDGCPAVFTDDDRKWFDPRAFAGGPR